MAFGGNASDQRQTKYRFFRYATNRSNITRHTFSKSPVFVNNLKAERGQNPILVGGTPINGIFEEGENTLIVVNDAPHNPNSEEATNPTIPPSSPNNQLFPKILILKGDDGTDFLSITVNKAVALDVIKGTDIQIVVWAGIENNSKASYKNGHLEVLKYANETLSKVTLSKDELPEFQQLGWEPALTSYYSLDRDFTTNQFQDEIGIDQVPNVVLQAEVNNILTFLAFKPDSNVSKLSMAGFSPKTAEKIFNLDVLRCPSKIIGTVNSGFKLKVPDGQSVSSGSTFVLLENNGLVSFVKLTPKGTPIYVGN